MKKVNKVNFKTEIVTGECEGCKLTTLLVSIDNTFFTICHYFPLTESMKL